MIDGTAGLKNLRKPPQNELSKSVVIRTSNFGDFYKFLDNLGNWFL